MPLRAGNWAASICRMVLATSAPKRSRCRFLDRISESAKVEPDKLARVARQFITPDGSQVYPVRRNGRTVYVTVPED